MKFLIAAAICSFVFAIGVFGDISGPGCSVTVTTTARPGASWLDGDGQGISQIYDVLLTNSGPCNVDSIIVSITKPHPANITQSWNLDFLAPRYSVTNFGGTLLPGSSAVAGFILHFPSRNTVPSGIITNLFAALCPASCVNSQTSTGSGSGSVTGSGSTGTSGSGCTATVSFLPRAGSSFPSGTGIAQIYDVFITNEGICATTSIDLNLTRPANSAIQQIWNLQSISGTVFSLTNYGGLLQPGQTANAGFILSFPTQNIPSGTGVTLSSDSCVC